MSLPSVSQSLEHDASTSSPSPSLDLFQEPPDYRPVSPPPQIIEVPYDFTGSSSSTSLSSSSLLANDGSASISCTHPRARRLASTLTIHLLGSHPLWGHHIWNASLDMSRYLQTHSSTILTGRSVLELGAAAGIPSIVAAREGAAVVVASDYPEKPLIDVLKRNLEGNALLTRQIESDASGADDINPTRSQSRGGYSAAPPLVVAQGYLWGSDVKPLTAHLPAGQDGFDLLLLSDLIFNHQAHDALLNTMDAALSRRGSATLSVHPEKTDPHRLDDDASHPDFADGRLPFGEFTNTAPSSPCVLVFFTSHRPRLAHKDMEFFRTAEQTGKWTVERVGRWKREPMFPTDPGSAVVRGTVHGFRILRT